MTHYATADEMLALMALGEGYSFEPEPFRMQPSMTIVVPYSEYVRFIGSLPFNYTGLYTPIERMSPATSMRCYYLDMAMAVFKELYYSSRWYGQPTHIVHEVHDPQIPCISIFRQEAYNEALRQLSIRQMPPLQEPVQSSMWAYMSTLMQASRLQPAPLLHQPKELLT